MTGLAHSDQFKNLPGEFKLLIATTEQAEHDICLFERAISKEINWEKSSPIFREFLKSYVFFKELSLMDPISTRVEKLIGKAHSLLGKVAHGTVKKLSAPMDKDKDSAIKSLSDYAKSEELNLSNIAYLGGGKEIGTGNVDHLLSCMVSGVETTAILYKDSEPIFLSGEEAQNAIVSFYETHIGLGDNTPAEYVDEEIFWVSVDNLVQINLF